MMAIDLAAIRARAEAATEGPWIADEIDFDITTPKDAHGYSQIVIHGAVWEADLVGMSHDPYYTISTPGDREFIARAREDVPALCDAVEARDKEIERLAEEVESLQTAVVAMRSLWPAERWATLSGICKDHPIIDTLAAYDAKGPEARP